MSTTLYRKYRPQAWAEVAGQNHVKVTLSFEIATGRIAHAYLFSGPRGIGKTTTARIFAKALNCLERPKKGPGPEAGEPCGECEACVAITEARALDVIEIDAASNRGIDNVRENIIENSRFSPSKLGYKVFIIDEVHMLTTEAFNALLKTLEEPPPRVVFILATTELHKVPPTIVSRCQRFDFRKIPFNDLVDRLHALAEREKCKVDRRTLEEIARHSDGCLRDAEGLLGKVLTVGDGKRVTYDEALVVLPRSEYASLAAFVEALLRGDGRAALATLGDCLEGGVDLEQFAGDAVELLRKTLLTKLSGNPDMVAFDLDESQKKDLLAWSELADLPRIVNALELLMEKKRDMKSSHPVQLPLEIAVVRLCADMRDAAPAVAQFTPAEAEKPRPVPPKAEAPKSEKAPAPAVAKAEAAPVAVAAAEAVPNGEPVTSVDKLKARWAEFMNRAGEENHALPFLLGVGEPVSVVGQCVKIGFDFAFHKDKFNEEKNRRLLERALGSIVNAAVRVEGVLLEKKERMVHDDAAQPQVAMATGPVVADSLISAFGGRVVE